MEHVYTCYILKWFSELILTKIIIILTVDYIWQPKNKMSWIKKRWNILSPVRKTSGWVKVRRLIKKKKK